MDNDKATLKEGFQGEAIVIDEENQRRDRFIVVVMTLLLFSTIFLQKLGIHVGEGAIGINAAILWIAFAAFAATNRLVLDLVRLLIFCLLIIVMSLSMSLSAEPSRWSAFVIFLVMFWGFVFRLPITAHLAKRTILTFQNSMALIAVIVLFQQVLQFLWGPHVRLSIENMIPEYLLYPGFAYIRPIAWGSPYIVPNGFFLLEPSTVSGYLAAALVLELVYFRKLARTLIYCAALMGGMALTGILAALISMPFWFRHTHVRGLVALGVLATAGAGIALQLGWLDPVIDRAGELSSSGSSAYARLIVPMQSIGAQIGDPKHWVTGLGAGSSPKGDDIVQWPFSKLLHEYGLLSAAIFHIFIIKATLGRDNYFRAATVVLVVPYLFFGGGFVAHASIMPLLLLGPFFLIIDRSSSSAASTSPPAPSQP